MGKKTLFHPISLNVLRGSAELSGYELGVIRQVAYDQGTQTAFYNVQLRRIPAEVRNRHPLRIKNRFAMCFMGDVQVLNISYSEAAGYACQIATCIASQESDKEVVNNVT